MAGTHRSSQFEPGFSYETTSPILGAWLNVVDIPGIYKIDQRNPNDPYVLMWSDAAIVDQTDQCGTNPDPSLGRRAADWIEFLTSHPGLDASEPVSIDFGTVTGQQVELAVADGSTTSCPDHGGFYVGLLTQPVEGRPSEYGLPSNERMLVTVVDVGDRTVVMQTYGPGDADEFSCSHGGHPRPHRHVPLRLSATCVCAGASPRGSRAFPARARSSTAPEVHAGCARGTFGANLLQ